MLSDSRDTRGDPQLALLRTLLPALGPAELIAVRSIPWTSATFEGARHVLEVELVGDDGVQRGARLAATLADAEFTMRDHFVAEIAAVAAGALLTIEALTIVAD